MTPVAPGLSANTQYQCTAFNCREDHRVLIYKCCPGRMQDDHPPSLIPEKLWPLQPVHLARAQILCAGAEGPGSLTQVPG